MHPDDRRMITATAHNLGLPIGFLIGQSHRERIGAMPMSRDEWSGAMRELRKEDKDND